MKPLAGLAILVVDDESDLREILKDELTLFGASVTEAEDGTQAKHKLSESRFDVLISDVRMPNVDGIALIQWLHGTQAALPKIFLCSGLNDIDAAVAKSLGVIDVFGKPFEFKLILQAICKAFSISPVD